MSSQNGVPIAPAKPFATAQRTTTFLPDAPLAPWQGWLYGLTRAQWLGLPLIRWLYLLQIALAALWFAGWLPGGWPVSLFWLATAAALWTMVRVGARRHFATFRAAPTPPPSPHILPPAEKRPVYITGALSVEAKSRPFTALPGFYRSFATREHALIGRVQPRRIAALATWPEDEIGLWYAFLTPSQITAIAPGQQLIGRQWLPALALTYRPAPTARRRTPDLATLYLAFPNPGDHTAVLADLLADGPPAPPNE
jgi:hypothetical protein